jgi:hypothetical protein
LDVSFDVELDDSSTSTNGVPSECPNYPRFWCKVEEDRVVNLRTGEEDREWEQGVLARHLIQREILSQGACMVCARDAAKNNDLVRRICIKLRWKGCWTVHVPNQVGAAMQQRSPELFATFSVSQMKSATIFSSEAQGKSQCLVAEGVRNRVCQCVKRKQQGCRGFTRSACKKNARKK